MKHELEKKKCFFISSDTFKIDIACFINYGHAEMVEKSKKLNKTLYNLVKDIKQAEDTSEEEGQMYSLERGFVIRVKFFKDQFRTNVGTIIHEITHVVQYILKDRRIPLNETTEEVYAYLTEDLLKKFLNKWY